MEPGERTELIVLYEDWIEVFCHEEERIHEAPLDVEREIPLVLM